MHIAAVRRLILALLLSLLTVLTAVAAPGSARADGTTVPVTAVTVERLDNGVTKTTIHTAFATAADVVEVFNYVPVQQSPDWRKATSMDSATWLFKPGGGTPKLAIFFTVEHGLHVAQLYDDQLQEGAVPVAIRQGRVQLSHPLHWTLKAQSPQPWISPDGRPADDLFIESAFSLPHEDDALSFLAHRWHQHDAWTYRLADPKDTGVPEYSLLQLFPQLSLTSAVPHTTVDVNVAGYRTQPFIGSIFWPYLGNQDIGVRAWFDRRPPLSMDWRRGQLLDFGSIIPDLEPEQGMQIFSLLPVAKNKVTQLDFENPFAYYRFDPGHTGFPNLIIRHAYFPAGDPYLTVGATPDPGEFIRYSWGNGDGLVLYKLGLLGRYAATTTLQLGDYDIRTMDYAGLPAWVLRHQWDFVTFVASETGGYRSSEGIYAWDYTDGVFSWEFGDTATFPQQNYRTIDQGLRGEYAVLPTGTPQLYLSPIDQRLHLLGAERGVWTVDATQGIHTGTLNGDTVDHWTRTVAGVPEEAVYALPNALIYADGTGLLLEPRALPSSLARLSPPMDRATLDALRQRLPTQPADIADYGLQVLPAPSDSKQVRLWGVALRHVRLISGGWQGELDPTPDAGLQAGSDAPASLVQALAGALRCRLTGGAQRPLVMPCGQRGATGPLILRYDGAWHVATSTPANVGISSLQVAGHGVTNAEMPLQLDLVNRGGTDATDGDVLVWAERQGKERMTIARLGLDILAGEQKSIEVNWLPPHPGLWTIGATLEQKDQATTLPPSSRSLRVDVPAEPDPAWSALGPAPSAWLIGGAVAILLLLCVLAAVTVWVILP